MKRENFLKEISEIKKKEIITEEDRDYLYRVGTKKFGYEVPEIEDLLQKSGFKISDRHSKNNKLKKSDNTKEEFVEKNDNSGFIQNEQVTGFSENNQIKDNNLKENKSKNNIMDSIFTDVTNLSNQGAMSLVQKGKFEGQTVAIKRIKPEFREDNQYIKLLNKEYINTYELNHENIVRFKGKDKDEDGYYIFMEFIEGNRLTTFISENGIKNGDFIKTSIKQLLNALDYAHMKGVVHRDLKPDNILIKKDKTLKLIDFGFASADYFDDYMLHVGTDKYASPEQKINGSEVDKRSDIYSFGKVLLEMLTGQTEKVEYAKKRSPELYKIIKRCLQDDITERYDNCTQILTAIDRISIKDILPQKIEFRNQELRLNFGEKPLVIKYLHILLVLIGSFDVTTTIIGLEKIFNNNDLINIIFTIFITFFVYFWAFFDEISKKSILRYFNFAVFVGCVFLDWLTLYQGVIKIIYHMSNFVVKDLFAQIFVGSFCLVYILVAVLISINVFRKK